MFYGDKKTSNNILSNVFVEHHDKGEKTYS